MTAVWSVSLRDSEKLVLLALADNANDKGFCWPSIATISGKCSKDDRTVQRAIKRLCVDGHMHREDRPGRGTTWHIHPRHGDTPVTAPPKPSRTIIAKSTPCSLQQPAPKIEVVTTDLESSKAIESWNTVAERVGWRTIRKVTDQRRAAVRARLRDAGGEAAWREALNRAARSPFLAAQPPPDWFTLDWLVKPTNFVKLEEGNYDHVRKTCDQRPSGWAFSTGPSDVPRRLAAAKGQD